MSLLEQQSSCKCYSSGRIAFEIKHIYLPGVLNIEYCSMILFSLSLVTARDSICVHSTSLSSKSDVHRTRNEYSNISLGSLDKWYLQKKLINYYFYRIIFLSLINLMSPLSLISPII